MLVQLEQRFVQQCGHILLDPFSAPIAADSMTQERYKGQKKLDHYMDTDEYYDAYDAYMEAKDALSE